MSNIRITYPFADAISIITQTDLMTETSVYETVKFTPSSVDEPSTHVIEYRSYW